MCGTGSAGHTQFCRCLFLSAIYCAVFLSASFGHTPLHLYTISTSLIFLLLLFCFASKSRKIPTIAPGASCAMATHIRLHLSVRQSEQAAEEYNLGYYTQMYSSPERRAHITFRMSQIVHISLDLYDSSVATAKMVIL